jgi:hypothetical protein
MIKRRGKLIKKIAMLPPESQLRLMRLASEEKADRAERRWLLRRQGSGSLHASALDLRQAARTIETYLIMAQAALAATLLHAVDRLQLGRRPR